jgi:uncharacterized OsmC-like protein
MDDSLNQKPADVIVRGNATSFLQEIEVAPDPYDYILAGLGACTSMTIGLYARRMKLPLESITVSLRHSRIYAKDCEECETKEGMLDRIDVEIALTGALASEQRAKLMEMAGKCPVHRTLTSEINVRLHEVAPL